MRNPKVLGSLCALAAAAIYGGSFALAKHVQSLGIHDLVLIGLVYFTQAVAFIPIRTVWRVSPDRKIQGSDWKWLFGAALFGGTLGPILYFYGQKLVPAYTGAMLAPTEVLFTTAIAMIFFHERLGPFEVLAVVLITIGAAAVGYEGGTLELGALLVLGGFLMWGIDNNCTTRISNRDPILIALYKGLFGGSACLAAGLLLGGSIPVDPAVLGWVALLGIGSYGISYVIFILGMRLLGASRATALFGTNVAFGVAAAWLFRGENPTIFALIGGGVIVAGVYLLLWAGIRKQGQ